MKSIGYLIAFTFTVATGAAAAHDCPAGTAPATKAPLTVNFVTSDIDLFWRAYAMVTPETMADVFDREYLQKGSSGLKDFTRLRIGDGASLAKAVNRNPKYYSALRSRSQKIESFKPAMLASFQCFRALYPSAVMPDVFFVIGRMNSAGTVTPGKLLIGVDMSGRGDAEAMSELGKWHAAVVTPMERLPYIVAHELIHTQQVDARNDTVLSASLTEGIADFIGQLISGQTINPHLHEFARTRHAELWNEFEKVMNGKDWSRWLYQGEKATAEWPADLGYYMGFRIAEAYYARQTDKLRAIADMLHIRDYPAFLKASGYADLMRK